MTDALTQWFEEYGRNHSKETLHRIIDLVNGMEESEWDSAAEKLLALLYYLIAEDDGESIQALVSSRFFKAVWSYYLDKDNAAGFDLNYHCQGLTPMGYAVRRNHFSSVKALLSSDHLFLFDLFWDKSKIISAIDLALESDRPSPDFLCFLVEEFEEVTFQAIYRLYLREMRDCARTILQKMVKEQFDELKVEAIQQTAAGFLGSPDYNTEILNEIIDEIGQSIHTYPASADVHGDNKKTISNHTLVSCNEKITFVDLHRVFDSEDIYEVIVKTDQNVYAAAISYERECCEQYGGYLICEDAIKNFVGAELYEIYLTDTCLNTHVIDRIGMIRRYQRGIYDYYNIMFINFRTSKGLLQLGVYNCHNGFYGHDVTVRINNKTVLFKRKI